MKPKTEKNIFRYNGCKYCKSFIAHMDSFSKKEQFAVLIAIKKYLKGEVKKDV